MHDPIEKQLDCNFCGNLTPQVAYTIFVQDEAGVSDMMNIGICEKCALEILPRLISQATRTRMERESSSRRVVSEVSKAIQTEYLAQKRERKVSDF